MSRRHKHHTPDFAKAALFGLFAASLTACGGSDSASSPAPAPTPVALATISGVVADGPLSGAVVCYDLNDNSQCDADEPASEPTDADGRYSLEIDPELAGKHRVLAMVPATAIDKDTGSAVGSAFSLVAPASGTGGSQTIFVSPLTTLVQTQIDVTGSAADIAAAFVQSEAGLEASPLADFTATADAAHQQAATVARLLLMTWNQKAASLSGIVGQTDLSGSAITEQQLRQVVARELLGVLPAVAAAASTSAVREAATPAAREAALMQAAQNLASSQIALSAEAAKTAIGIAKLPLDTLVEAAAPTGSLVAFRYQDANNWYFRSLLATTADNTLDASGQARYYEHRSQRAAGVESTWARGNAPERAADLHWGGSAWVSCPYGSRSEQMPPDAFGRGAYTYCAGLETGFRVRSLVDVAGRSLRSVIETIREVPGANAGVIFADWGPADLNLLGTATMPAGSMLSYQTNTVQSSQVTYDQRDVNRVVAYPAAIAAGGDARNGATPPCANSAGTQSAVNSLEEMIALNPGSPCMFNPTVNTGDRNDWWSNSTVSLGLLADAQTPPEGTGSFFTRTAIVRVGFVGGSNAVNFYSCLQRASDGSTRNCTQIGSGTYSIASLGDARTMSFNGLPELALRLSQRRYFVERGGKVYYGGRSLVGRSFSSARLNLPAANALFEQLGLPKLTPAD